MQSHLTRLPLARRILVPLAAGLAIYGALLGTPRAADSLEFILPDSDGYGIADCMRPGMECGRVIADAWCEAHGHGHASNFGLGEDVTGSVQSSPAALKTMPVNSVVIRCGE